MNIVEYIEKVDKLITDKREAERQKALFNSSVDSTGLGFMGHISDSHGNITTIMGGNGTYIIDGETYYTHGF